MLKPRSLASVVFAVLCLAAGAPGREPSLEEYRAVQDSLHRMPMRMQSRWLAERGIELPEWTDASQVPSESGGLRMVGKWGRGPAVEVTGRDSFLFLSLGSEVAILNIANPDSPAVLAEVQVSGLVLQSAPYGPYLYIACRQGFSGIEIWNISDPSVPVFQGRVAMRISAFCIQDSFIYTTTKSSPPFLDTFKVFSLADPENPQLVGWCRDSGDHIAASGNKVVLGDWGSIHIMDVSDQTNPHRVGDIGVDALGLDLRGNLVCAAEWWNGKADDFWFDVFDITDPTSPRLLSEIHGVGGYDIHLSGPLAFVSGFYYDWEFTIVNLADSTRPSVVSTCVTPGWNDAVWADWTRDQAYVADDDRGLTVVDISNLNSPVIDSALLLASGLAVDVSLCDTLMYVATWTGGMQIVNVSDPAHPISIAEYDSVGYNSWEETVVASDSFAYVGDFILRPFRVLDVSDPLHPQLAGHVEQGGFNPAEDMVLRDSFVYCVEANRFQLVNVARPREPALVGSCASTDGVDFAIAVQDTFAYIAADLIQVVNVARPDSPRVVTTIDRASWDLTIEDSMLFCEPGPAIWYSLTNPAMPVPIDSIDMGHWIDGLAVVNRVVYACSGPSYTTLYAISIADLHQPRVIAEASLPYTTRRIVHAAPYLYMPCWYAGVCIYETTQVGIQEPSPNAGQSTKPMPTVVRGAEWRKLTAGAVVFDAMGRRATQAKLGVYFVIEAQAQAQAQAGHKPHAVRKVVLTE